MASIDYSDICIGEPEMVLERVINLLRRLLTVSANLRVGLTCDPSAALRRENREVDWPLLKLVYATHVPVQAIRLGQMLRAWDAKLYDPQGEREVLDRMHNGQTVYAYIMVR